MRGEKLNSKALDAEDQGSPPHARGKEAPIKAMIEQNGITPACAGKRFLRMEATA